MAYQYYNPNPRHKRHVGDCVIRAIARATDQTWEAVYCAVCAEGFADGNMPSGNDVWGNLLRAWGFRRVSIPDRCDSGECYTLRDFCVDHPVGTFVIGTGTHAVCVRDGDYYDIWDSGDTTPEYAWEKPLCGTSSSINTNPS